MEQPIQPQEVKVSLSTTIGEVGSRASGKVETLPLASDREEVVSRGSEEEVHSRFEEGNLRGFCSPHDQRSIVKLSQPPVVTQ